MKSFIDEDIMGYFISFLYGFSSKSKGEFLSGLIISVLPYIILMLIFGLDLIGAPLSLIFTFFKSLAPTLLFSFLYKEYGLKGAEYVFLVLAAGEIVSLFGALLICTTSYRMSQCIKESLIKKDEFPQKTRNFFLTFSVGTSIIIFSRLITFATITSLNELFVF